MVHEFGDCTDHVDSETVLAISEEILYYSVNVDDDDLEGIAFRDYAQNADVACDPAQSISA